MIMDATSGAVEQASEEEIVDVAARVDRTEMFNCLYTGVALGALEKLRWKNAPQMQRSRPYCAHRDADADHCRGWLGFCQRCRNPVGQSSKGPLVPSRQADYPSAL